MTNKRAQASVFIIIAIFVVAAAVVFVVSRGSFKIATVPEEIQPVYASFLSCVEDKTLQGISVLESQGGYIDLPTFEPGSQYMPFSSQLNFVGTSIPYWYYVSGNNIPKTQVPTVSQMQSQLSDFVEKSINSCDFHNYYSQGFNVALTSPIKADVVINNEQVSISLTDSLNIAKGEQTFTSTNQKITVDSKLGSLYNSAKKVYDGEQKSLFLENYAVDTLRLYAPVDGVEISCSPLIYDADKVFGDLRGAIEANTLALNVGSKNNNYFNVDVPAGQSVRFLNSRNWSSGFEVNPSEGKFLVSNPVGNQQGMGIIGFCYVPYHYVYNVRYPVLVQVYSGEEIFQFPVAVVLENNNPRVSLNVTAAQDVVPQLCATKNSNASVSVQDTSGNPIQADLSYECIGQTCNIGQTNSQGKLSSAFPQCANGFIVAKAVGFEDTKYLFSTVSESNVKVIMDKLYTKNVQLKVDGKNYDGDAIVYFTNSGSTRTLIYPQQRGVELSDGQYDIQVYIYKNTSITLGATTSQQCIDISKKGILGVLGLQEKKCFDIQIPSQVISNALAGGGNQSQYILETDLNKISALVIDSTSLPSPDTIQKIQDNYNSFDSNGLNIYFN